MCDELRVMPADMKLGDGQIDERKNQPLIAGIIFERGSVHDTPSCHP